MLRQWLSELAPRKFGSFNVGLHVISSHPSVSAFGGIKQIESIAKDFPMRAIGFE